MMSLTTFCTVLLGVTCTVVHEFSYLLYGNSTSIHYFASRQGLISLYVHDKAKNQRKRTREKYNEKIIPSRFSCDDPVIILNPITQDSAALPQAHESKGLYKNIQHFNNGKRIRTYRDKEIFFKDC
jgi:hypothetical protein